MPSITYWSRLEPRPRSRSIADSLAARVRDPLWMLTRQWQFGEFQGEDAGSPAFAQIAARVGRVQSWSVESGEDRPLAEGAPLEAAVLAEDFSQDDLSLAVELGQVFEQVLIQAGRRDLVDRFRTAYPMDKKPVDIRDEEATRFLQVVNGRCTHGVDLFLAAESALPDLPPKPVLELPDEGVVHQALVRLRSWVRETIGPIGQSDALAWNPERLEYDLRISGQGPDGSQVNLAAHPNQDGRFEWYSFDAQAPSTPGEGPAEETHQLRRSIIPANITFRGMPQARWWSFESGTMNLGAVRVETREIAKLILLDFMLVHSNDWFVVPFPLPLGSLCDLESLVIPDVFGDLSLIERADRQQVSANQRCTAFSTTVTDTGGLASFFLLPPVVGDVAQSGDTLEEVRFVRDEMANMAWGVERFVQNRIGEGWPAHERSRGITQPDTRTQPSTDGEQQLRYQIQTFVPENWIPFLPVAIDQGQREVQFERGVLLQSAETRVLPTPVGRILQPTKIVESASYHLREEEIPRVGLRVVRLANRSRWVDGSTHVWISRQKLPGTREETSGLRFDLAV